MQEGYIGYLMRNDTRMPFFDISYKKCLKSPKDFIVEEIIDPKFTRKFLVEGSKVGRMSGKYSLCKLEKGNRTTESVINQIAGILRIPIENIGFAGLKDKDALTTQYITIKDVGKEKIDKARLNNAKMIFIQHTNKHISKGDLICNRFAITLHGIKNKKRVLRNIERIREGFPNYFGPQRFGINFDNHIKGKYILKREFKKAGRFPKEKARFLIHAYQSYLFNKALVKTKNAPGKVKVIGYDLIPQNNMEMKMLEFAKKDGIKPRDFKISEIMLSASGTGRDAFVKPIELNHRFEKNNLILEFGLPKGSYASVLLQVIMG